MDFFDDILKTTRPPETEHLYRVHPHFDRYPRYMQEALLANERLQGRMK